MTSSAAPPCPNFNRRYAASVATARTSASQAMNRAGGVSMSIAWATRGTVDGWSESGLRTLTPVPEFSPGLEGVVAAETAVSEVDGANGRLIYRGGYLIEDLAAVATFEETAYLLWNGELPDKAELEALTRRMAAARKLNASAKGVVSSMDPATDPMDTLRTVISAQGASKTLTKPTLEEAIALTAIVPTIVAAAHRRSKGMEPVDARDDLGHAANMLWMMEGSEAAPDRIHWLDAYLVLLADHGLNASTFTAG